MSEHTAVHHNGVVEVGSKLANDIGFTADKFNGYLWLEADKVWISFIVSIDPGKGNLSRLFDAIEGLGYRVVVPTPLGHMEQILKYKGFIPHAEQSELGEYFNVWEKPHE